MAHLTPPPFLPFAIDTCLISSSLWPPTPPSIPKHHPLLYHKYTFYRICLMLQHQAHYNIQSKKNSNTSWWSIHYKTMDSVWSFVFLWLALRKCYLVSSNLWALRTAICLVIDPLVFYNCDVLVLIITILGFNKKGRINKMNARLWILKNNHWVINNEERTICTRLWKYIYLSYTKFHSCIVRPVISW